MRVTVYAVLALLFACLQHTVLAAWLIVPDLPLALAAWAMVDGEDDGVLTRAFISGFTADLLDPGAHSFHLLGYVALALAFLPLRAFVFRTRFTGWAGWAFAASLLLTAADRLVSAPGDVTASGALVIALLTAGAAIAIGWLAYGLPEKWRPVAKAGA